MEGLTRECRNCTSLCGLRPKYQLPTLRPVANGLEALEKAYMAFAVHPVATMTRSPYALPNTAEHYPLTNDQLREVQRDVLEMNARADELASFSRQLLGRLTKGPFEPKRSMQHSKDSNGQCSEATRRKPLNCKFRYRLILPGHCGGSHGQHQ